MVRLVPMAEVAFQAYYENAVHEYAQEHIKAGSFEPATAMQESRKQFEELLPDGVVSKNQHLYSIQDAGTNEIVGMIWFALKDNRNPPSAFIYDFNIYPAFQRKGYGKQALHALEDEVKKLDVHEIELHVFGHNKAARALYDSAGGSAKYVYPHKIWR